MSVGFCGTPYLLKRYICNVCGVLWDSLLYILKKKWSRLLEITFNHFCGVLWVLWCIVGFSHTLKILSIESSMSEQGCSRWIEIFKPQFHRPFKNWMNQIWKKNSAKQWECGIPKIRNSKNWKFRELTLHFSPDLFDES